MYDSGKTLWRKEGGRIIPKRGLVFFAPLWHPGLSGSPFNALDLVTPGVHACTVTGAVWGSQGRTFDGVDDVINCGKGSSLNNLSALTYMAWINPTSMGESNVGRVFDKGVSGIGSIKYLAMDGSSGTNRLQGVVGAATTDAISKTNNNAIALSTWQHVAMTYDDAGDRKIHLFVNGVEVSSYATQTAAVDAETADSTANQHIGNEWGTRYTFSGIIGGILIYNRALTPLEIQNIYLATKWRYNG